MTERRRNFFVLLLVFGLLAGSAVVVAAKSTKLGLDLQGGVSLVYQAKPTKQQPTVTPAALDRAVDIIRERVDALGVGEPSISRAGNEQIEVDLPAVEDAQRAADQVGSTAQLYFYDWELNLLDPKNCQTSPDQANAGNTGFIQGFYRATQAAAKCKPFDGKNTTNASQQRFYGFDKNNEVINGGLPETDPNELWRDFDGGKKPADAKQVEVPAGVLIVRAERPTTKNGKLGPQPDRWWLLRDDPALSGTDIKDPKQAYDQQGGGGPIVTMEFTNKGKNAFQSVTQAIAQRGQDNALPTQSPLEASQHFAIVLDNQLVSTPFINYAENPDGIDGETGAQISGGFTVQSAQDLAKFLEIGALPVELENVSRSQVSATLGQQALDQGLIAGLAGFVIVALFLLTFYRVLGLVAVGAMLIYAVYFYALIKLIPVVLTLPGIAGLVLGLGVAADANIVVFERVKEEVRKGRSTGAAIAEGFKKGISTIIDANVVTILVAFILFILATAQVRGFALTLGLGTIVSLITAVLATQAILLSLRNTRVLSSKFALGASDKPSRIRIDFMGASRWFFSISGMILLIGALGIASKTLKLGIDFESGTKITASLTRDATVNQVRSTIEGEGFDNVEVQKVTNADLGKNVYAISTGQLQPPQVGRVEEALQRDFGTAQPPSSTSIGPTFGKSIANSALVAIIASLLVISVYIALRFEWKYAVPVLIALAHDILITGGVYALVGREVTASTVAALLTILGYSLYDTIIVFDRIRENAPRMPNATFSQIVNRSASEVIVRSLATSFSTLLPVLALLLFGGDTLKDFAFALLVGIASGAYSSLFIAGPVLVHWKEREPIYRRRRQRVLDDLGHVPAYAAGTHGAEVEPPSKRRVTTTSDPAQGVSDREFDELVANLGVEDERAARAGAGRPGGGRRARAARGEDVSSRGQTPPPAPGAGGESPASRDAGDDGPSDAGGSTPRGGRRKSRNARHGRPR